MLNPQQLEAVEQTEGYVRVVAGAGTGKTQMLVERFSYLVNDVGVPANQILCITFTNKSAREMKDRIKKKVANLEDNFILTFHSLAVRILREEISYFNWPRTFQIIDEKDKKDILKKIYKQLGLKTTTFKSYAEIIEILNTYKRDLKYFGTLMQTSPIPTQYSNDVIQVIHSYLRYQQQFVSLDFSDLIGLVLYLFQKKPEIAKKWADKFVYIMVDEYQDSDNQQVDLLDILQSTYQNYFVVGDINQCIYRWRGALPEVLMDFDKTYPSTRTIFLTTNYRSTPQILQAANDVIRQNTARFHTELNTMNAAGPRVSYYHAPSIQEECAFVLDSIKDLVSNGVPYEDITLLYRNNYLSRRIESELIRAHMPYKLYSGYNFFERQEIKDMVAYLRMLVFADDLSFLRTINTPKRGIGPKKIEILQNYVEQEGGTLFEALEVHLNKKPFVGTPAVQYVQLIRTFQGYLTEWPVDRLFKELYSQSGYEVYLKEDDGERIAHVVEFEQALDEAISLDDTTTLETFLQDIALLTTINEDAEADRLRLMTIHAAKGLEFSYVFVLHFCDGILPSSRSLASPYIEAIEDERRLAYVALTRAKEALFLCSSEGISYNEDTELLPSRFIFEISSSHLHIIRDAPQYIKDRVLSLTHTQSTASTVLALHTRIKHPTFGEGEIMLIDKKKRVYLIHFPLLHQTRAIQFAYNKLTVM